MLQHLRPWSTLLSAHASLLKEADAKCACFITIHFRFIGLVNYHLGLNSAPSNDEVHVMSISLNGTPLPFESYFDGRSAACAYGLYKLVPIVSELAPRKAQSDPRHLDSKILQEFQSIEERILCWEIPVSSNSLETPDRDEITAAIFLQMALLVTLQCALNGPGLPSNCIRSQIDSCLYEARNLLKTLPPSSMAWAFLLWPMLHIGSCIVKKEEQDDFVSTVLNMEDKVPCCTTLMSFLHKLWNLMERGENEFFGPYGIRELMIRENIQPSLG